MDQSRSKRPRNQIVLSLIINFEGYMSTGNFYLDCIIRLAFSFVCGFALGLERKTRQHTVGMRTLILISTSCTLMAVLSVYMTQNSGTSGGDPTRIAAGVVTGIGFLGGGAILRQGMNIRGLTSAAVIWTAASLGLAAGAGLFIPAAVVLVAAILTLIMLEKVEGKYFPAEKTKTIRLEYRDSAIDTERARQIILQSGFVIRDVNMSRSIEKDTTTIEYSVKAPAEADSISLCRSLEQTGTLTSFTLTD